MNSKISEWLFFWIPYWVSCTAIEDLDTAKANPHRDKKPWAMGKSSLTDALPKSHGVRIQRSPKESSRKYKIKAF